MSWQQLSETRSSSINRVSMAEGLSPLFRVVQRNAKWKLVFLAKILDMLAIAGTSIVLFGTYLDHQNVDIVSYCIATYLCVAMSYVSFQNAGLYKNQNLSSFNYSFGLLLKSWIMSFLILSMVGFLLRPVESYSRVWGISWFVFGGGALFLERMLIAKIYQRFLARGAWAQPVVVVGTGPLAKEFILRMKNNDFGIKVEGVFDDRDRDKINNLEGVPRLGSVNDLLQYAAAHHVESVVITLPLSASERLRELVSRLKLQPLNVYILPDLVGFDDWNVKRRSWDDVPGVTLVPVASRPISGWSLVAKTGIDFFGSLIGLIILAPFLAFIAIGIKISSPGPMLFRQRRYGYKGNEFTAYKFRTMHHTATPSEKLTARNDPRIYKFGSFLRKTSLDELPQLLNVLKGEMSIIGPRPHVPTARAADQLYFEAVTDYASRHRVKPGITGWAQINGWRGPTETVEQIKKRVEHDIYYIDNWSLWLDLKILIATSTVGFVGKNAF